MADPAIPNAGLKRDSSLTPIAFRRFLDWLDEGADSGGQKYLEMHRRLVSYFDRKSCLAPDDLADETLSRVARRLQEEGSITDTTPAHYCYIIAKFVFLEYLRRKDRRQVSLDEAPDSASAAPIPPASPCLGGDSTEEGRMDCLARCLQNLNPGDQALIIRYYRGEKRAKIDNRRELAGELGFTINALAIRACRIRGRLETCVRSCLGQ